MTHFQLIQFQPNIQSIMNFVLRRDGYCTCDFIHFSWFYCFTCVKYIFVCIFGVWYVLPYAFLFLYAKANMPRKPKPSINAQQSKLGPIYLEDIEWTPKIRKRFGNMLTIMIANLPSKSTSKNTAEDVKNLCLISPRPWQKWWYLDWGQGDFQSFFNI